MEKQTLELIDFESHGITKETLARYYTIKTGLIAKDIFSLPWKAVIIPRIGRLFGIKGLTKTPTTFNIYLCQLESIQNVVEIYARVLDTIQRTIALEDQCVNHSTNALRNAFKEHGRTEHQYNRHVVRVQNQCIKVFQEVYIGAIDLTDKWIDIDSPEQVTWLESFIWGNYPDTIAEKMLDHISVLKMTFVSDNPTVPLEVKVVKVYNDAGLIVYLAIGNSTLKSYLLTMYSCDFINNELEATPQLKSLIGEFL